MKKIKQLILTAGVIFLIISIYYVKNKKQEMTKLSVLNMENNIKLNMKTSQDQLLIANKGQWQELFLKGVNMGTAKPGYYPGEFGITKEEYLRWFKQIAEMNSNVIRVYTLQMPVFYEALEEYNLGTEKPLYLIQGVWLDEDKMKEEMNAFSPEIQATFKEELIKIIDVLHGKGQVKKKYGEAYGQYKRDVSSYVIAYILGTEWDPYFASATNEKNKGLADFKGSYIYTTDASPIEVFLADVLEGGIAYESETYGMQKAMAITNWLTTDALDHSYDIEEANRLVSINVEHIKAMPSYCAGLFASYHVYPYYPDFLNAESPYVEPDEKGEINSYKRYLEELKAHHTLPIVVSEFGIPTSRGISHVSQTSGFNQGMIDEQEQGKMLSSMISDIYETNCAGAIIFSWQDEWFKRTWNTMLFDDPDGRASWIDYLTNEQCFGLLAFDPGSKQQVILDGELNEFKRRDIVSEDEKMTLSMKYDEGYLYFGIHVKDLDLTKEQVWIPIGILPGAGAHSYQAMSDYVGTPIQFTEGVQFIIQITGEQEAKVMVQDYYDATKYLEEGFKSQNPTSTRFDLYGQAVFRESVFMQSGKVIPYSKVNIGELNSGHSNPEDEQYRSLSDFNVNGDHIEIRIPWLMLNISNPAEKLILDDFQKIDDLVFRKVEGIQVSAYVIDEKSVVNLPFELYSWKSWKQPSYHERLKPAYEEIKQVFAGL